MPTLFNFSRLRFVAIVLATTVIGRSVIAQPYSAANDPLVQRTVVMGEKMMSNQDNDRYLTIRDPRWGDFPDTVQSLVYIPSRPPALGEELPAAGASTPGVSRFADVTLDPFFGAYSILVGRDKISAKEAKRVAAYRDARQKLVQEIQAKFEDLSEVAPAVRRAALTELAARQDGQLWALAEEAEAIRSDLEWVGSTYGLSIPIRRGVFHMEESIQQLLQLFDAAWYADGLSTEQRLLLPEMAYARNAGSSKGNQELPTDGSGYFNFLPATARIRLPANLPPWLEAKIRAFVREKESLKSELRSAVLQDDHALAKQRSLRLATLAGQQAPRFAAMETLAEEIRVGLADFGYPDQSGQPVLPADLIQRVGDFQVRKREVQRELLNRLRGLRKEFPKAHFDIARQGDGLAIVQTETGSKAKVSLLEFNASLASRYTAFAKESAILRSDIQRYTATGSGPVARTVGQVALEFEKAYNERVNERLYRNYSRAVLEPGLSPAQRHLLFQSALTELDQARRPPQS